MIWTSFIICIILGGVTTRKFFCSLVLLFPTLLAIPLLSLGNELISGHKPVQVSHLTNGNNQPANLVDGQLNTDWNAGTWAPVWVRIDLLSAAQITAVRLFINQMPSGFTSHSLRFLSGDFAVIQEILLEGATTYGQMLEYILPTPLDGVRFVEVETTRSPSWIAWQEIEVYGTSSTAQEKYSRGEKWVRNNPIFISGLNVSLGTPNWEFVQGYFDDFHANAAHFWETGAPDEVGSWYGIRPHDFRFVTWLGPDGVSMANGQLVGDLPANYPGRIGFQISDEPSNMDSLLAIRQGVNAVRAADPEALLIVNYGIGDNTRKLMEYNCRNIDSDVISYDWYVYQADRAHRSLALAREMGLRCQKPYFRYLKSYYSPNDSDKQNRIDGTDMRWDAFSGLVYGFTGLTWFLYQVSSDTQELQPALFERSGDFNSPKTALFYQAAELNRQIQVLGPTLTQLRSTDVRYVQGKATSSFLFGMPDGTRRWGQGAGGDLFLTEISTKGLGKDLLIGFFQDEQQEEYVMIQSMLHKNSSPPQDSTASLTFNLSWNFASAPAHWDLDHLQVLNHRTGAVELLPLRKGVEWANFIVVRTAEIRLDAGDIIFFKYATGHGFVQGPSQNDQQ